MKKAVSDRLGCNTTSFMETEYSKGNFIDRYLIKLQNYLRVENHYARELLAEFVGTAFLILVGESANATQRLSRGTAGDLITTNLAWGFAVFFAIMMSGSVSGGLFNPAIAFAWAFLGKLPWKKVIPYCLVEIIGAFCGAAIVYFLYQDAINAFDGGIRQIDGDNGTAGIFATYPAPYVSIFGAFIDQIIGTMCLVTAILATIDPQNGWPPYLIPLAVAFYVTISGSAFSFNAGGAINPARDLGPRLFTAVAGWGFGVFSYRDYWFWIPTFCPLIGALLGAAIYNGFIGIHHDRTKKPNVLSPTISISTTQPNFAINPAFSMSQQSLDILGLLRKTDSIGGI